MIIYPAIDIKDGRCVRLFQGREGEVSIYGNDPVLIAKKWQEEGAEALHVVDLDGAFKGKPQNLHILRKILQSVIIPIQFGGGVRELNILRDLINWGVARVVLGTRALTDLNFLREVVGMFDQRILVGIDVREGKIAIEGWKKTMEVKPERVIGQIADLDIGGIVYTNINRDGTLRGPDIKAIENLAKKITVPFIASGGISSLDDIKALKKLKSFGLQGIIIGKALYEGKFTLKEAIEVAKDAS